ncbi:MAG: hypothetical protein ACYC8T_06360 [Myxococcaceae bacterium]
MRALLPIAICLSTSLAHAGSYSATYELYLEAVESSDREKVQTLEGELLDSYASLPKEEKQKMAGRYAQVRFLALEPEWKSYQEIRITDVKALKNALVLKVKAQQELERAYVAVIALKIPEPAVASKVRIGQAYADLAKTLRDVPIPPGLSEEQAELFRAELENRCQPLDSRATEAFEGALAMAKEHGVSTWATRIAAEQLARYQKKP